VLRQRNSVLAGVGGAICFAQAPVLVSTLVE